MAHACEIACRSGDEVHFRVQAFQLAFEYNHGEDGGAGGNVAGAHAYGVGGHHTGASIALRRSECDSRLQRACRIEQLGALFGQRARRSACNQRSGSRSASFHGWAATSGIALNFSMNSVS